jgi:hypothetical protein
MTSPLGGKAWEDLETLEFGGRLYFPDVIKRRTQSGALEEVPICIRVPRKDEKRAARLDARAWASRLKVDTEKDSDLFDDMDSICILARAIRERNEPHDQFQLPDWLEEHFDSGSLAQLWDRLQWYEQMVDPRLAVMDEDQFWTTVLAIGRTHTALPLTDFGPDAQKSFVLSAALQALLSPTLKSYLESRGSSTPAQ